MTGGIESQSTDPTWSPLHRPRPGENVSVGSKLWNAKLDAVLVKCELDRLRTVIDNAPHDSDCNYGTCMNFDELYPCTCWKADAL